MPPQAYACLRASLCPQAPTAMPPNLQAAAPLELGSLDAVRPLIDWHPLTHSHHPRKRPWPHLKCSSRRPHCSGASPSHERRPHRPPQSSWSHASSPDSSHHASPPLPSPLPSPLPASLPSSACRSRDSAPPATPKEGTKHGKTQPSPHFACSEMRRAEEGRESVRLFLYDLSVLANFYAPCRRGREVLPCHPSLLHAPRLFPATDSNAPGPQSHIAPFEARRSRARSLGRSAPLTQRMLHVS